MIPRCVGRTGVWGGVCGEEGSWGGGVCHGEEGCVGKRRRSWGGGGHGEECVAACGVMLDNALLGFGHHIFVSW